MPCSSPRSSGSRRTSPAPSADAAPDWVAAGTPEPLRSELVALLGADRVLSPRQRHRPLRLRREPLPAASRRSWSWPATPATSPRCSPTGAAPASPVTFRAGGTSLNGQGQTDGILVDVRRHFRGVAVEDGGARVRVKPGHRARPRQPRARAARLQARARPGLDRHRLRRRRDRQQLRRDALRRHPRLLPDGQRAHLRARRRGR